MPKSYKCKSFNSSKVPTLPPPIFCIKFSLLGLYSNTSDILKERFSERSEVKYNPASNMCLVAVLEFAAANFCTPTNALESGVEPSRASLFV